MTRPLLPLLLVAAVAAGAHAAEKQPTAPVVDLAAMVELPAATFTMGQAEEPAAPYGDSWYIDQVPAHEVSLGTFHLDPYEVTVEQFALFLTHAAGEYHYHPDQPIERVTAGYLPVSGAGTEPIRHVTWQAAQHYCRWAGKRLPTEAEWERAAAGLEVREYPWGSDDGPSCARAAHFTGSSYCSDGPLPVGSHPDGDTPDGVHDLAGNVAEWVSDRYGWYGADPQTDPTGPDGGSLRVIRGGGYLEWSMALRTRTRHGADPTARSSDVGFRCAYSDPPDDGALRGPLSPAMDEGRQATDRPLAPAVEPPEVLASGFTTPTRVVLLDGVLYVLDTAESAVYAVDETELEPQLLAGGFQAAVDLVTDGQSLLLADGDAGDVWSLDAAGNLDLLASGQDGVDLLLAGGGEVFWSCDAGLVRFTAAGGSELLVPDVTAQDLALSPTHLYFTSYDGVSGGDELTRVPRAGGDPEVMVDIFYSSYDPVGLVYDPDDAVTTVLIQRSGWPSNVQLCQVPDGAAAAACFAHSPPNGAHPVLDEGILYWVSQFKVVAMDLASDETYTVVGTWADSRGLTPTPEGLVWTDADDGRVYRAP